MKPASVMAVVLLTLSPAAALAGNARPWLAVAGGFHTFRMGDVNSDIEQVNTAISPLHMDDVNSGFGFGAAVGADLNPEATLEVGYERLQGSSKVGDATGSLEYSLPANEFTFRATFRQATEARFALGFGAAAGLVTSAGEVILSATGAGSVSAHLSGSGPALEAFVSGDWRVSPRFAVTPHLGFRYAKISETKAEGQVLYNPDGSKYSLDYSGLTTGVELKLFFEVIAPPRVYCAAGSLQ
jgi:hypothetical protein